MTTEQILELVEFQSTNPEAEISVEDGSYIVSRPWDDPSIELVVDPADSSLKEDLNSLRLPPKFYAIWHTDTKDFEIIFRLVPGGSRYESRSFEFVFEENVYKCEFDVASCRLINLVNSYRPCEDAISTEARNLRMIRSFNDAVQSADADRAEELTGEYTILSFYVRNVEFEEEMMVSLTQSFNLYTTFYDRAFPLVHIHHPDPTGEQVKVTTTPNGTFPERIVAHRVDDYMYSIWEESVKTHDAFQRFLHTYQIIEYASFYYLKEETNDAVRRIVSSPAIHEELDTSVGKILDILTDDRTAPEHKFQRVISKYVEPSIVWNMMEPVREYFQVDRKFDGGYVQKALIREGWELSDFALTWASVIPDTLRKMRNAVVHSREQREALVISPTRENEMWMDIWSELTSTIAMQIMIARHS